MLLLYVFQLPGDKILGLAKFFLGIGIPGDAKDFFNQVESLAFLETNRQVFFLGQSYFKWHLHGDISFLFLHC